MIISLQGYWRWIRGERITDCGEIAISMGGLQIYTILEKRIKKKICTFKKLPCDHYIYNRDHKWRTIFFPQVKSPGIPIQMCAMAFSSLAFFKSWRIIDSTFIVCWYRDVVNFKTENIHILGTVFFYTAMIFKQYPRYTDETPQ